MNGSVYYTYDLMDGSSSFTNAIAWDSANDIQIFVEYNSSSSTLSFIHYRTDKSTKRTTAPLDLNGFYKYWAPDDVKVGELVRKKGICFTRSLPSPFSLYTNPTYPPLPKSSPTPPIQAWIYSP